MGCVSMGRKGGKGLVWSPGSGGDPAGQAGKLLSAQQRLPGWRCPTCLMLRGK